MSKLRNLLASLVAIGTTMGSMGSVHAVGENDTQRAARNARSGVFDTREPTLAPFAHVLFCKRNPAECRQEPDGRTMAPDDAATMALIKSVNRSVNASIRATADAPGPLGDVWNLSPRKGDCDDYAVTKRHRLIAAGLPAAALRLAVTRTRTGEGHAVLIVTTQSADVVLDNRVNNIRSWHEAALTLVKIQSSDDPRQWFAGTSTLMSNR